MFDDKTLSIDKYSGDKKKFQTFAWHIKQLVKRESAPLEAAMRIIERETAPTGQGWLQQQAISEELDAELQWILVNHTEGGARALVRSMSGRSGLEMWRTIANEADPRSGAQESENLIRLIKPDRAKSCQELRMKLHIWEELLRQEESRATPG